MSYWSLLKLTEMVKLWYFYLGLEKTKKQHKLKIKYMLGIVTKEEITMIGRLSVKFEGWEPGQISVKRLGGKTNRNYKVQDVAGKNWFVRVPFEGADIVDRSIEAQNIKALQGCKQLMGVVPAYYLFLLDGRNFLTAENSLNALNIDLPDGTMVTEFVEGTEMTVKLLRDEKVQQALVETLCRFHSSGVKFVNSYNPLRDEMEVYKRKVADEPKHNFPIALKAWKQVCETEKLVADRLTDGVFVSTHNDLNFSNWLVKDDRSIILLDWEYSGYNTCGWHYDIGGLLGENMLHRESKNYLTIELFEQILKQASKVYGKEFNREKVYVCALANVLVTFWWAIMRYFQSKGQKDNNFFRDLIPKRAEQIRILCDIVG